MTMDDNWILPARGSGSRMQQTSLYDTYMQNGVQGGEIKLNFAGDPERQNFFSADASGRDGIRPKKGRKKRGLKSKKDLD